MPTLAILNEIHKKAMSFTLNSFKFSYFTDEKGFCGSNTSLLDIMNYDFDEFEKFIKQHSEFLKNEEKYKFFNLMEFIDMNEIADEIFKNDLNDNDKKNFNYNKLFDSMKKVQYNLKTLKENKDNKKFLFRRYSIINIETKKYLIEEEMSNYENEVSKLRKLALNENEKFKSFCKLTAKLLFRMHIIHPFFDGNTRSIVNCFAYFLILKYRDLIPKEYHAKNGYPILIFKDPNVFELSADSSALVDALKFGKESDQEKDLLKDCEFMNNFREVYKIFQPFMIPLYHSLIRELKLQIDRVRAYDEKCQLIEQIKKEGVNQKGELNFHKLQKYNFDKLKKEFKNFISNFSDQQNIKLEQEIDAISKILTNESQYYIIEKIYKLMEEIIKDCLNEQREPDFKKVEDKINFTKFYEEFVIEFMKYFSDKEKDELYKKIDEISSPEKKYELIEEIKKNCLYKEGPHTGQLNLEEAIDKIKEYDSKVVNLKDAALLQSHSSEKNPRKI